MHRNQLIKSPLPLPFIGYSRNSSYRQQQSCFQGWTQQFTYPQFLQIPSYSPKRPIKNKLNKTITKQKRRALMQSPQRATKLQSVKRNFSEESKIPVKVIEYDFDRKKLIQKLVKRGKSLNLFLNEDRGRILGNVEKFPQRMGYESDSRLGFHDFMKTIDNRVEKNEYKYYQSEILCKYMEISSAGKYSTLEQNQGKIKQHTIKENKVNKRNNKKYSQIDKEFNRKYLQYNIK